MSRVDGVDPRCHVPRADCADHLPTCPRCRLRWTAVSVGEVLAKVSPILGREPVESVVTLLLSGDVLVAVDRIDVGADIDPVAIKKHVRAGGVDSAVVLVVASATSAGAAMDGANTIGTTLDAAGVRVRSLFAPPSFPAPEWWVDSVTGFLTDRSSTARRCRECFQPVVIGGRR